MSMRFQKRKKRPGEERFCDRQYRNVMNRIKPVRKRKDRQKVIPDAGKV